MPPSSPKEVRMVLIKFAAVVLVFAAIISAGVGVAVLITHLAMNALDYGGKDEQVRGRHR